MLATIASSLPAQLDPAKMIVIPAIQDRLLAFPCGLLLFDFAKSTTIILIGKKTTVQRNT